MAANTDTTLPDKREGADLARTVGKGKAPETAAAEDEDVPGYEPTGDEKLSRSYLDKKEPIPDTQGATSAEAATTADPERSATIGSVASPTSDVGTTGSGARREHEGATFANGAATTGPNAKPDLDEAAQHTRAATAGTALSEKTKSKLTKAELKDGKRLTKIIQSESKAEKAALEAAIKELATLQKQQSAATKRESKAHAAHVKALALHHKTETKYLALKAEYEKNQLNSQNMEASLESERTNARDVSERVAEQAREVEKLRVTHATDEREREAKILELNNGKPPGGFLCF